MFIVDLAVGLIAGAIIPPVAMRRWNLRQSVGILAVIALAVLVALIPVSLSTRTGLIIGLVMGLAVAISLVPNGAAG